jgi:hypothetical protein
LIQAPELFWNIFYCNLATLKHRDRYEENFDKIKEILGENTLFHQSKSSNFLFNTRQPIQKNN